MLKIKQSYHGDGGIKGYKWHVYNSEHDYLGELEGFPFMLGKSDVFSLDGVLYSIKETYDSDIPYEMLDEVVYYTLTPYNDSIPVFNLRYIK